MELSFGPADAAFQAEVRAFLASHLTDDLKEAGRLTSGVFAEFAIGQRWQRTLYEKGWAQPAWPVEHGGTGWSPMQRFIFERECAAAGAPRPFAMGGRMVGPVLMRFGSEAQKARYLPRILSGEDVWCQGYSEPASGSDLASLQTRARADGDDYVINGTKLWTTGAQYANRMFCLVRTRSEAKPQQGITFLLLDMDMPGISVEPIITLAGDHEVNQVFLDDVRVPKSRRVGEENQGWTVAKYLLEFERGGTAYGPGLRAALARLRAFASAAPGGDGAALIDDAGFRRKLEEAEIAVGALDASEQRLMSAMSKGQNPGAASSMLKTRGSEMNQWVSELAMEAAGYYAAPFQPEARVPGGNVSPIGPAEAVPAMPKYLNYRAASIYAGSNEIQRNIMAKLVLGL